MTKSKMKELIVRFEGKRKRITKSRDRSEKQGRSLGRRAASVEGPSEAVTDDSEGEELGAEEGSASPGLPALFRSPTGKPLHEQEGKP